MSEFGITCRYQDDVLIVAVTGDAQLNEAPQLRNCLTEAVESKHSVVVDLGGTTFMDSTVLAVLVGALKRHGSHGLGFALVYASPSHVETVLRVTSLHMIFKSAANVDRAVELINTSPQK